MSLHANLAPEALDRLRAQRRNSTVSSILIAFLAVVLIAVTLGIFLLPSLVEDPEPMAIVVPRLDIKPEPVPPTVNTSLRQKPSSPSSFMPKVIAASTISPVAVPVLDVETTAPVMGSGKGDDFGQGWNEGPGDGGDIFKDLPTVFEKRCSKQDRLDRLRNTGGNPQCEDAVVKALDWLQAKQSADGSWSNQNQAAMTGLALLAYLGHCETPHSQKYGATVLRAITYLVDIGLKTDGKLSTNPTGNHWPYEHAIATYALAEAATFCKQANIPIPNLYEVTQKAGQFIILNQHGKSGGWDYNYDTYGARGGDLSVTAWQIQALKACHHTGLEFKGLKQAARKAMDYVASMQCADGGFAYAHANEAPHAQGYRTLTGAGVLCLQMWDKGSSSTARKGAKYIGDNTKFDYNSEFADLYGHYYEAQAMMNRGGNEWKKYNDLFRDQLLNNQSPDGSWPAPGGGKPLRAVAASFAGDAHYRTCLCTLMLEVYYRFLPGTGNF